MINLKEYTSLYINEAYVAVDGTNVQNETTLRNTLEKNGCITIKPYKYCVTFDNGMHKALVYRCGEGNGERNIITVRFDTKEDAENYVLLAIKRLYQSLNV